MSTVISRRSFLKCTGASAAVLGAASLLGGCKSNGNDTVVEVKVGDTVKAADTVVVLEAMKMENAIHAGKDGRVASIDVAQGDAVPEGGVLITLE